MKNFATFCLVLAALVLTCQAYWGTFDLEVKTNRGHVCNFEKGNSDSMKRARTDTCTRDFEKKKSIAFGFVVNWWEASRSDYPWCYHNDGTFWKASWDWCVEYLWSYSVNDDQLLIRDSRQGVSKTAAKNKKCYYSYYYTARSYYAAVAECKKKGNGWDLASFQAVFEFKGTELVNYGLAGKSYDNLVKGISPLDQTLKVFWIKNENKFSDRCILYNTATSKYSFVPCKGDTVATFACERDF